MSNNCWLLIVAIILIIVGTFGLLFISPPRFPTQPNHPEYKKYQWKRGLAIASIVVGVLMGVIWLYNRQRNMGGRYRVRARMNGKEPECKACDIYTARRKNLQPYKPAEVETLRKVAAACNTCSDKCLEELELAEKYEPHNVSKIKKSCVTYTENAILANNDLKKIGDTLRQKQTQLYQQQDKFKFAAPDPFPKVPY